MIELTITLIYVIGVVYYARMIVVMNPIAANFVEKFVSYTLAAVVGVMWPIAFLARLIGGDM